MVLPSRVDHASPRKVSMPARDDEGRYAHVGDPKRLPGAQQKPHQQANEDGQVDVELEVDDEHARQRAHQGHHAAHRKVDVAAGDDAHQHDETMIIASLNTMPLP